MEGEMAEELLAVPGPSGLCAGSSGSRPPVPVEEPTAAATPAAGDLSAAGSVVTESPLAAPERGSEEVQLEVITTGLPGIGLSEPAAQAAAAAPAMDSATVAKMVSEALFALELDIGVGAPKKNGSASGRGAGRGGGDSVGDGAGSC